MKKYLSFVLLALALTLTGCSREEPMPTPPSIIAIPTESTAPNASDGESGAIRTAILREGDEELRLDYTLLAVAPEAPFAALDGTELEDAVINTEGADALIRWLHSPEALDIAAEFGMEAYGDNLYYVNQGTSWEGEIPQAKEDAPAIRLHAAAAICQSGLLDALLPRFEERYGYTVEVRSDETLLLLSAAKRAEADVLLVSSPMQEEAFIEAGFARSVEGFEEIRIPFVHSFYVLCGPADDPAGVGDCGSVRDAFAAIAGGEHLFISRGDGLILHTKELTLWPDSWESHSRWYVPANTETGPTLVMAEQMGGYVLCDKRTYLIFKSNDGII